ncbi:MAG: Vacuolar H+transporting two-sector ATPase F subunit [Rhodocyclaceae bacterium]|nr:MAG: Vacuolar H+transporting two-sector ATPase F subunit [Rhodocyclaceae bacterium]
MIIYLGSEAEAAGFRLAGIEARAVATGSEAAEFSRALNEATLLLIGGRCAERLPAARLADARAAAQPLLMVLDDVDVAEPVRRLLGGVP